MAKILSLDLSTHCGYAVFKDFELISYGVIHSPKQIFDYGQYPYCYVKAAEAQIDKIASKVIPWGPFDSIVVETINNGRSRWTQQLLNFLHFALINKFLSEAPIYYVDSIAWRSSIGLTMTKDQKKANAKLSKAKREAAKTGKKLDKTKLGVRGKVTQKHLAVAWVNEKFGKTFKIKDNDICDAIALGYGFLNGARISEGI